MLKNLFVIFSFLMFSVAAIASSGRYLDGQFVTNGAFTLTIPSITDTFVTKNSTDTLTNKTIDGGANTLTNISLGSLSGTLGVANGGTGNTSFTANGIIFGAGSSALSVTGAGSQYQLLQAGALGVPEFGALHLDQSAAITGLLPLANGGTGAANQSDAANNILPSQTSNSGKFLTTNGSVVSWGSIPAVAPTVTGTRAAPTAITAAGGISFSGSAYFNIKFIEGDAGAVTVTADPQIAAGTSVGQQLVLIGRSATNTVTLADGTGLSLNGSWVGGLDSVLTLVWDGSVWAEVSRR